MLGADFPGIVGNIRGIIGALSFGLQRDKQKTKKGPGLRWYDMLERLKMHFPIGRKSGLAGRYARSAIIKTSLSSTACY